MSTELLLIRHAPSQPSGRLYGRTDVTADVSDASAIAALRAAAGPVTHWYASPARRCRMTLAAIWGDAVPVTEDARLWEQDFGDWDGRSYSEIPDHGALPPGQLARHCPPGGESFRDLCARAHPAIRQIAASQDGARIAIVTHAGVVRAALALGFGAASEESAAQALSFEVRTLSLTHLRVFAPHSISVACTNWCPRC